MKIRIFIEEYVEIKIDSFLDQKINLKICLKLLDFQAY